MAASTETEGAPKLVKSAARVADVINLLGSVPGDYSVTRIAKTLQIPKSSAHGLLETLRQKGLVTRDANGNFSLSIRLLAMATSDFDVQDLRDKARPIMQELSNRFEATTNLAALDGDSVIYIEKVQSSAQTVQIVTYVGGTLPAHATALGKTLVGHLAPDEREEWLAAHDYIALTKHTLTSRAAMEKELEFFQAHGYAVDDEEFHEGVLCIAAPVFNHTGRAVAAMSLTGIKSRWLAEGPDRVPTLGDAVREAATRLSELLGHARA